MEERGSARAMFDLVKWYADAVSAEGDYLVGYCARLRCGRFGLHYSSVLDARGQRQSLRRSGVAIGEHEVRWTAPALDVDLRWERAEPELHCTLYSAPEGSVDWRCVVPRGALGSGCLGYVERLRLTIPPWRLPIRRLRWGRFLSARHSVVWIDWAGDFTTRVVFVDGAHALARDLDDDALSLEDGARLSLDRSLVLRSGPLGSTVFRAVPGLERIAPARMFRVEETKWRSRGVFEAPGEPPDTGWSIHEVVTWP